MARVPPGRPAALDRLRAAGVQHLPVGEDALVTDETLVVIGDQAGNGLLVAHLLELGGSRLL